jgi:hypothetical protein
MKKPVESDVGKMPAATVISFSAADELRDSIADWADRQTDTPTLSTAARRLVEIALADATVGRPQADENSTTARDLAAAQIDRLSDENAPAAEQAIRKRRLLKGPSEFRDERVDRPKKRNR